MSTRAIVAVPHGDSWRGRYTHSDGYPTWLGRHVWAIVQRDGVDKAQKVFTEDYVAWSEVGADRPDLTGVHVPANYDEAYAFGHDSLEWKAYNLRGQVNVPGYGIAVVRENIDSEAWWRTPETTSDSEWVYLLADDALWVFKCHMGLGFVTVNAPTLLGRFAWSGEEPDWQKTEEAAYA
jgi:hypothetical protein